MFNNIINNAHHCGIIDKDGGGALQVSKFLEGKLHNFGLLGIEKEGP
jgi:hypothetical protein